MESEKGAELADSVEGEYEVGAKVEDSSSSLQTVYTNLTPVTIQDENGLRQVGNHGIKQFIVLVFCYAMVYSPVISVVKVCLHVLTPSQFPSKFNVVSMLTCRSTGRLSPEPNLPIDWPVDMDIMLNFDGNYGRVCAGK